MKKHLLVLFLGFSSFLSQAISDEALLKYGPLTAHFQKKYNMSHPVAQAFVRSKIPPANAEMRKVFEAALQHNNDQVKTFLTNQYSKKFGSNWQNVVLDTIKTFLEIDGIKAIELKKGTTMKGFHGFAGRECYVFAGKEISDLQKQVKAIQAKNPDYNKNIALLRPDTDWLAALSDLYFPSSEHLDRIRVILKRGIILLFTPSSEGKKLAKAYFLISQLFDI